jgi:ABC-type bacteriocin/lantibiotic exporter with double-glycine peptidase domain
MIISDLMKMVVVLAFMFYMNWTLWIVIVLCYRLFLNLSKKMQVAFEDYANCQYERTPLCRNSGMKIVQLFNREKLNTKSSNKSTTNTKLLGLKQFFITPYFSYC